MDAILRRLVRAAFRRGIAGNWAWLVIAGAVFILRRALADKGGTVTSLKLLPGEQVLISVRDGNGNGTAPIAALQATHELVIDEA
jgi:hypothetical protein